MLGDSISASQLCPLVGSDKAPFLIDVRREAAFSASHWVLPAARRANGADPAASLALKRDVPIVCYCAQGHNVGQMAAARLRADGHQAAWLEGGFEAYQAAGGPLVARAPDQDARFGAGTLWVTRRRPKIDRIACPWFIRRFVDAQARFLFVENAYVLDIAAELDAIAFDVEGAPVTHDGPRCSFDALLERYLIEDKALRRLADIVRGADTAALHLAPEAGGLLSISLGLSVLEADDHAQMARAFTLYDGLYAYLRFAAAEPHNWPPAT